MNDAMEKARAFAISRHGKQSYGGHPYRYHLDSVARITEAYGKEAVVVAYLHDVVEDTPVTLEVVASEFGPFVSRCVALLTDEPGSSRRERKERTYKKLARVSGELELALIVKAADRLANLRACMEHSNQKLLRMYQKEHSMFRRSVYRPKLCDELWKEMDNIASTT